MACSGIKIIERLGIAYSYDRERGKHLSFDRIHLRAGASGRTVTNQALRLEDGQPAMSVGDHIPRIATIVGLTANCETPATWTVEICRKSDPDNPLVSFAMIDEESGSKQDLNVDILSGDILIYKVKGTNIPMPRIIIEIAWRL